MRVRHSAWVQLFGGFLFIAFLVGCTAEPQSSPMRLGTNLWPGYEPLYLAENLNLLSKDQVRLVEYPSASEVIRAFRNHSLEAAALTLDEALSLRQDDIPAEVVLVLDISDGADVIIAREGIGSFTELQDHKVAVESGALGAYMISRALEINAMSLNDIEVVHMDVSDHEQAFKSGQVDAVVTFEPVRTKLLEHGGKEVFSSKQIPGEVVDVLVIHRDYLLDNLQQAHHLASAWFDSIEYMSSHRQQAAEQIAKRLKIPPAEVIASYDGLQLAGRAENREMLKGVDASLNVTLDTLAKTMLESDLLVDMPNIDGILSDRLLQ